MGQNPTDFPTYPFIKACRCVVRPEAGEVTSGWGWYRAAMLAGDLRAVVNRAKTNEVICSVLREIFGNPFRPVAFDHAWRMSDVMALGQGIYEEKAFDRMPILADALQDAGCESYEILNHLRDATATHVRGCWALDLVLGKE